MMGWCPYDGEECRHDGYCKTCPHNKEKPLTIDEEYAHMLLNMTDEEAAEILEKFYKLYSTPVARKNGKTLIQLPIHAVLLKAIEKLKGSD